jgi:hypothetical protein
MSSSKKKEWSEKEDNDTLVKLHIETKYNYIVNKKTSFIYKYINKLLGFLSIISSSVTTAIIWTEQEKNIESICDVNDGSNILISDLYNGNMNVLKTLLVITIFSTFTQNFFNLIDISNEYKNISESYGKYKNIIECIGDIHPKKREGSAKSTLPVLRYNINKLKQTKRPINCLLDYMFEKIYKDEASNSYLKEKNDRYSDSIMIDVEDSDEEDYCIHDQYLDNNLIRGFKSINL